MHTCLPTYMNDYILLSIDRSHLSPILFYLEVHLQLRLGQFQALDKARVTLLAFSLTLGRLEELAPIRLHVLVCESVGCIHVQAYSDAEKGKK